MNTNGNLRPESAARAAVGVATLFGVGFAPTAPGTVASIVALPVGWILDLYLGRIGLMIATALVFLIGTWACGLYARAKGQNDPSECVVDEVAGQWTACLFAPFSFLGFGIAFVLFRIFDILKPWPISWFDKEIPGGLGIMADDVIAGLMAGVILLALNFLGLI